MVWKAGHPCVAFSAAPGNESAISRRRARTGSSSSYITGCAMPGTLGVPTDTHPDAAVLGDAEDRQGADADDHQGDDDPVGGCRELPDGVLAHEGPALGYPRPVEEQRQQEDRVDHLSADEDRYERDAGDEHEAGADDSDRAERAVEERRLTDAVIETRRAPGHVAHRVGGGPVSYTHLRAHET